MWQDLFVKQSSCPNPPEADYRFYKDKNYVCNDIHLLISNFYGVNIRRL